MKFGRRARRSRGFTLMEVLLVLVILVLLGGTASVFFINVQKNAYIDTARTQINSLKQALDLYRMDVGSYPTEQEGLEALRTPPASLSNPTRWRGPYMKDPIPNDPWDNPYVYRILDADTVQIISFGPDRMEGTADDISG
ncbi:MAG: type II secretion system protein GspG [Pirellulaceae bacterium]|nr:MAG: type II secretion system protein GspG [Pirellulaceae bacterium]